VLRNILNRFAAQWQALEATDSQLIERLRFRCVLTGRRVAVDFGQERIAGLCLGIAEDGALLIDASTGLRRCYAGVVAAID
jgi:biotin-(acetyl-CoA carboxylase) ligase